MAKLRGVLVNQKRSVVRELIDDVCRHVVRSDADLLHWLAFEIAANLDAKLKRLPAPAPTTRTNTGLPTRNDVSDLLALVSQLVTNATTIELPIAPASTAYANSVLTQVCLLLVVTKKKIRGNT